MIAITYYSTIFHNKLKLILLCEYILLKVPMDVVPDTANQRPQRDRRRPTHLQHNGHTQGTPDEPAVRARKSNSTACRQVPPRIKWVPILASEYKWGTSVNDEDPSHSRKQFPICLAWALTVWKAQGMTIKGLVRFLLGDKEKQYGLTYVGMSRVEICE